MKRPPTLTPQEEERQARQRERNLAKARAAQARARAEAKRRRRRELTRLAKEAERELEAADRAYGKALAHPDLDGLEAAGSRLHRAIATARRIADELEEENAGR